MRRRHPCAEWGCVMFGMLKNLTKAAASVVVTPAAVVADVLTLPASAYANRPPFELTEALLKNAGRCVHEAIKPEEPTK